MRYVRFLVVFIGVLAIPLAETSALPGGDWQQWESEHFVVYSAHDARSTLGLLERLEFFHDFLTDVFGSASIDDTPKPKLFLFPTRSIYAPYAWGNPKTRIAYMLRAPDDNYIAASWTPGVDTNATLYHELTHFYLGNSFGLIPLWVDEGLAVYYSTFVANREVARVGRPGAGELRILRNWTLQDVTDVVQVRRSSSQYNEEKQSQRWYSQAWILTHYIMHELADGRAKLRKLLEKTTATSPDDLEEFIGLPLDVLNAELRAHVQREELPHDVTPITHLRRERKLSELRPDKAELYAALGHLLLRLPGNHATAAREHFEAALANQEDQPLALIGLARVFVEDEPERADDCCARALDGVADANAYLTCGEVDYAMAFVEQAAGKSALPRFRAARARLHRAIEIAPNLTRAYVYLGYCHLTTRADALTATTILEGALERTRDYQLLPVLGLLYKKSGEIERGRELLTQSLSAVTDPELREQIQAALDGL